jgi:glycosyltransferase involved in cell wall biosynthesis
MGKRIFISTTNDIFTDNRVHKVAMLLLDLGYEVCWIGRELPSSTPLERPYQTRRMKLIFRKGGLFYAEFQLRLLLTLFFAADRKTVLLSNDLDTLLPNFLISRFFGIPIVYDSHEYFCGVPEIQGRWVKRVWQAIEGAIFPKLPHVWTVNESIAGLYEQDYGNRPRVFRNISPAPKQMVWRSRAELGLPEDVKIAINQGSGMNVDRGLEEALEAVAGMDGWLLLLVGTGDAIPALQQRVRLEGLEDKVRFVGRVPYAELLSYTACANVGLSLDKDTNINYRYSLPNKLFDYIHCGVPVVTSKVVEVARVVDGYGVGRTVDPEDISGLRAAITAVGADKSSWKNALDQASAACTWEQEAAPLKAFYEELLQAAR